MAQQNNIRRTFWELISNYVVEIPQIQRDYAQGRDSALDLRNRFLNRILESLKNPENNNSAVSNSSAPEISQIK